MKKEEKVLIYDDIYVMDRLRIWMYLYVLCYDDIIKKKEVKQLKLNQYQLLLKKELLYMMENHHYIIVLL